MFASKTRHEVAAELATPVLVGMADQIERLERKASEAQAAGDLYTYEKAAADVEMVGVTFERMAAQARRAS